MSIKEALKYSSLQSELIATLRIITYLTQEQARLEAELQELIQ